MQKTMALVHWAPARALDVNNSFHLGQFPRRIESTTAGAERCAAEAATPRKALIYKFVCTTTTLPKWRLYHHEMYQKPFFFLFSGKKMENCNQFSDLELEFKASSCTSRKEPGRIPFYEAKPRKQLHPSPLLHTWSSCLTFYCRHKKVGKEFQGKRERPIINTTHGYVWYRCIHLAHHGLHPSWPKPGK